MKKAYGMFCSRHAEAVEKYKEHYRTNKLFKTFMNVSPFLIDVCSNKYCNNTQLHLV